MKKKTSVLFVCLGNICRSPVAEAVFQNLVFENELGDLFEIDSAATSSNHIGERADPRTRKNAQKNGVEITHRARQLHSSDFTRYDYILAMDQSNLRNILSVAPSDSTARIELFASFDPDEQFTEVPDPYWGEEKHFQEVFQLCQRASQHFLTYLKSLK
jgi:protein-tyrosine phosphatase